MEVPFKRANYLKYFCWWSKWQKSQPHYSFFEKTVVTCRGFTYICSLQSRPILQGERWYFFRDWCSPSILRIETIPNSWGELILRERFMIGLKLKSLFFFLSRWRPLYLRLRVVPHFSSGIVERAKRKHAWKSTHATCSLFSRGLVFTRTRVLLALLSLRKNGGLLIV